MIRYAVGIALAALAWGFPGQAAAPMSADVPLDKLDAIVGPASTVVFGEDSHGMVSIHAAVPQIFQDLVVRKGFRAFVFESQWGVTDAFKDYFTSERTELDTTEQYFLDGAFVSRSTAGMLAWIRSWNRSHPADPVRIFGYQPEQPVTDIRAIFAYLDAQQPRRADALKTEVAACRVGDPAFKTNLDFLTTTFKLAKENKPAFTDDQRAQCLAGIDRIGRLLEAQRPAGDHDRARRLALLHVKSLRTYIGVIRRIADSYVTKPNQSMAEITAGQAEIYGTVDRVRFEILSELRALDFPKAKTFYWMHNWHAARHASEIDVIPGTAGIPSGTVSVGERIAAVAPASTVTIGTIVPCGTTCKEPDGSVEPSFARKFDGRTALVDLRKPADRAGLDTDRPGVLFANQHGFGWGHVVLRRQFDAILYIPRSDPIR